MSLDSSFQVEGKVLKCDSHLHDKDFFEIKSTPRAYRVSLDDGDQPFAPINQLLRDKPGNVLLIDQKLVEIYQQQIDVHVSQVIAVPATESFKTFEGMHHVFDFLYERGFTKSDQLVVVGGGIIQDVGAFTAACYKRGIRWVYFPTTLLAMCDSCIGSKSGLNYKEAKNQMALFSAPSEVFINLRFLDTLAESDLKSGLGEILKLAITGGAAYLSIYQQYVSSGRVVSREGYKKLIMMALGIKRAIVEEDEFELYHRKGLNYGHTLGHAIEVMTNYAIPHGVAVTIGMMLANEISAAYQFSTKSIKQQLNSLCRELLDEKVLMFVSTMKVESLLPLLKKDKKTEGDFISFVVVKQPGDMRFARLKLDQELQLSIENSLKQSFN